jgi:hypothetical protein
MTFSTFVSLQVKVCSFLFIIYTNYHILAFTLFCILCTHKICCFIAGFKITIIHAIIDINNQGA